jgi:ATP-dependent Clp protease ATP-binding subunit ClpB
MQHEIDDRLASAILGGAIRDGDIVRVDLDGDQLSVKADKVHPVFDAGDEDPFIEAELMEDE